MKWFLLGVVVCSGFISFSQSYRFKILDPIFCFDYNRNTLIVIEDSTYRLEISLRTKKVVKKPLFWDGQVSFNELRSEFVPLSEKGSPMYFVDRGCGWLLELRNDSIVRIDQSFHHQNQFGGAFFVHNGEPYVFGGYGLFTTKSIMTRYDFELDQWFLFDEKRPRVSFMNSVFEKNARYLSILCTQDYEKLHKDHNAYRFDFESKKWHCIGATKFFDTITRVPGLIINGNIVIHKNKIYEFNLTKGLLHQYQFKTAGWCQKVETWNSHFFMFSILTNHHSRKTVGFLELFTAKQFKDKFFERSLPLYNPKKKTDSSGLLWIILSVCLGLLGVIGALWFLKARRLPNSLPTKGGLSDLVEDILTFWLAKPDYCIELSEINDFVNYDHPSPDNLKKRRETVLKQFSIELARLYKFQENAVFSTQVHPKDKRMKILVLDSNLVNKIKKEN
jgi:hypothetical protein